MKRLLSSLLSLMVVVPLLALLFAIIVVALVFACSLAQSAQGAVAVLGACGVGAVAISLLVSRLCLSSSAQARQLLRENIVVLVGVTACMVAMGSACSLVGLSSFSKAFEAGAVRTIMLAICLVELVLCCMMGRRLHAYLRQPDASIDALRKEVRVLLLLSALLSAVDFAVAYMGVQQVGVSLSEVLFEEFAITFADLMWMELVLATIKIAASISGVALLRKRRTRARVHASAPSATVVFRDSEQAPAAREGDLVLAADKTQVLSKEAIAA
ncbi:MAG: hypothetical protein IKF78_06020 [Atopobiaceae bacterium]|nr:hypothetical protein [Atopobiaceae bacterium]